MWKLSETKYYGPGNRTAYKTLMYDEESVTTEIWEEHWEKVEQLVSLGNWGVAELANRKWMRWLK